MKTFRILAIDAWRYDHDWTWNNWYEIGQFPSDLIDASPRVILKWLRENNILSSGSAGKVTLGDDGYNLVVRARGNRKPLVAIEYGAEA